MPSNEIIRLARAVSRLCGWLYFASWSLSFYPQPLANWTSKSTTGFAIDFPTLNIVGFASYTASTGAFFFNKTIRRQYAHRNQEAPEPTVRFNDFLFALHGAILCVITYSQFWPRLWGFKTNELEKQRASRTVLGIVVGCMVGIAILVVIVLLQSTDGGYDPNGWAWIDVLYGVSYVKLIATVMKYIPQVWMNYQRKSTVGFQIAGIWCDFVGGILSLGQLMIDSSLQADWSGLTGNPSKLLLANISLVFDAIFFLQHHFLYRDSADLSGDGDIGTGERQSLIGAA